MSVQLAATYAAIEFVEGHLRDEITVADIAAAAGYSLYHFIRTFNQTVHHTPYDYLMRRRLSEAARSLIASNHRILDTALDYQFNNHETFSRAFKRMFSMQPSKWRERGEIPYRSLLPPLTLAYLEHINQGGISQQQFTEREATHLVGLMYQGQNNIPELWKNLRQIMAIKPSPREPRTFYGVHSIIQNEVSFYFVGVEVASPDSPHPPLVTKIIPPGPYARFIHKGTPGTISLTLDYIYHTWLVKSGNILAHHLEVEHFGDQMPLEEKKEAEWEVYVPLG
jgi:AraC family transcriptional regulator